MLNRHRRTFSSESKLIFSFIQINLRCREFTINGLTPGGSTTLPDGAIPFTYYKYGQTPDNATDHWYEFKYDGTTGTEIDANVITLHFVDALRGDDVLAQDSLIIDLGAPAFSSDGRDDDDGGGGGGGCFMRMLSLDCTH